MSEKLTEIFKQGVSFAVLSDVKKQAEREYHKVQVKPFLKGDELRYQFAYQYDKKVIHENLEGADAIAKIAWLLEKYFNQCIIYGSLHDYHITSFGKLKMKVQPPTKQLEANLNHNTSKSYILPDGEPIDFLVKLGVMASDGKVLKAKYDKFRQINKYLELVSGSVKELQSDAPLRIIDFGCGKAYLTFALYYYLVTKLGLKVEMIGLDLKSEVIDFCESVARDLNYAGLKFLKGDIRDYIHDASVDMVITLHACDTATDEAIVKAVLWHTKVILTVPCCQHELFGQIKNEFMEVLTKHGIIKERLSSLITDSIRGQLLEALGYKVNIMEFIDMEHTPKNIMIKAIKSKGYNKIAYDEYSSFKAQWGIEPYLERRLIEEGLIL